jgi:hypothetical protein
LSGLDIETVATLFPDRSRDAVEAVAQLRHCSISWLF